MDKADRDRKRRQKALNRVEKAYYLFTNEAAKALGNEEYIPDLDDLETLAKYFEGAAKTETSFEELLKAREAEQVLINAIDECVKKCGENSKLENSKLEKVQ